MHRHTARLALAVLAAGAAKGDRPPGAWPLSAPELCLLPTHRRGADPAAAAHALGWSRWRRRHRAVTEARHAERRRAGPATA
jgi:hypothetical protein